VLSACYDHAVSIIQVKNVPPGMHGELRRRAGQEGLTIRDYVLKLIERDQRLPSKTDWLDRVAELEPVAVSQSAADVIREAREERDEELMARAGRRTSGRKGSVGARGR
jgi:antitoxin FitA